MDNPTYCAAIATCDKVFHMTRTSIYSFIEKNTWFNGTLYVLTHSRLTISQNNINSLFSIYKKIKIINCSQIPEIKNKIDAIDKIKSIDSFLSILSESIAYLEEKNILLFSNSCLFVKNVLPLLENNIFPTTKDCFYLKKSEDFLQTLRIIPSHEVLYASTLRDSVFNKSKPKISASYLLIFDTFTQNIAKFNYVNQIWLQANHKATKFLQNLKSFSQMTNDQIKIIDPEIVQRAALKVVATSKLEKSKQYRLDVAKVRDSLFEFEKIALLNYIETPPITSCKTACVIAFKDRHNIVELNVKCLNKQSLLPAIVLVASNIKDADFANSLREKYSNVFVTYHPNYPIGGKWSAGVKYAKKLGVNGVMILGSDDLLSLDYFKDCYSAIDEGLGSSANGVDLIGNRKWLIYDVSKKLYSLEYTDAVPIYLGGGKMFSKNFLDSVNWTIFQEHRPFHLDEYSYNLVCKFSNSKKVISDSNFILSIKGNWDVINTTNDIIRANHRIKYEDITHDLLQILKKMKLDSHDDLLI